MNRNKSIAQLAAAAQWDIIIIGGGATGLGCAVDAASRGCSTLLLEKYDFAKGTSSRATKLVHGGVRYLAQGNIRLVREALFERGRLLHNAPHLCHTLPFVVPAYRWWHQPYYGFGLWLYEQLSFKWSLGNTRLLRKASVQALLPGIRSQQLSGGVQYFDGQFDDSRLAIKLAQTAAAQGATVLNYMAVNGFERSGHQLTGVQVTDTLSGATFSCKGKAIINATGVFADEVLQLASPGQPATIAPSQGIHLVVDKKFFPGHHGLMIPKTDDGRVLFCIPWHDKVLIGTTDTPVQAITPEPQPLAAEIDFVLRHFNQYAARSITRSDVLSMFAGLRPLAKTGSGTKTAVMPRDHHVTVLPSGLLHITGGKWTTYRRMAEDAVTLAIRSAGLTATPCRTQQLPLHGSTATPAAGHWAAYGSDALAIQQLIVQDTSLATLLHPNYPYTLAEVQWCVQHELAQTVEDILARRIRLLFTDARAAIAAAPAVATCMAPLLGKDAAWQAQQVEAFNTLAKGYLP